LVDSRGRIALANARADLMLFLLTHVFAIERGCALWTDNATFAVGE